MGHLMRECRVIGLGVAEAFERRHLHEVLRDMVTRNRAAMPNGRPGTAEKGIGSFDAFNCVNARCRFPATKMKASQLGVSLESR
jgi:hypothetical protein